MSQAPKYPSEIWDGKTPNREGLSITAAPDSQDYEQIVAEIRAMQQPVSGTPAGVGVSAVDIAGQIVRTTLTFTNLVVNMTDATTAGCHGTQKIFDFPPGLIDYIGAVGSLTLAAGVGGITDTAAVVIGVGTAPVGTGDATLTTTEADLVPSTAATLAGGVSSPKPLSTASSILNGTVTAIDANLNIAVPDAGSTANDTITVNGTLTLIWQNLGDN